MTITAYTGLPGSGKSYSVVENVIVPALKSKRTVFTNIPMNDQECLERYGLSVISFKTDDLKDNADWFETVFVPGSVFVLDEVWRLWPAGLKANNVREQDKSFLAEHRHIVGENGLSTEIVLVTQDLSQIAMFARVLVETTYRTVKLGKLGFDKSFRVDVFSGPVTGPKPSMSKRERELYGKYKKEVYSLYKSHTKSQTGDAGLEQRTDSRYVIWKSPMVWGMLAFLIFAVFFVRYGAANLREGYNLESEAKVKEVPVISEVAPVSNVKDVSKVPDGFIPYLSKAKKVVISFNMGKYLSLIHI